MFSKQGLMIQVILFRPMGTADLCRTIVYNLTDSEWVMQHSSIVLTSYRNPCRTLEASAAGFATILIPTYKLQKSCRFCSKFCKGLVYITPLLAQHTRARGAREGTKRRNCAASSFAKVLLELAHIILSSDSTRAEIL